MALEEYWERGRGTGDAGLPLVVLVRIAVEGCGDASLIRKRSSDNSCDWRGEWLKGSGRLVMSVVGSQERSTRGHTPYACLCLREEWKLLILHSIKSTHLLHCICTVT